MLPAAIACDILLPPVKSAILTSMPRFLKKPSRSPTWTGRKAVEFASALPTLIVSAALAVGPAATKTLSASARKHCARARTRARVLAIASSSVVGAASLDASKVLARARVPS